jgi:hypothetical protein
VGEARSDTARREKDNRKVRVTHYGREVRVGDERRCLGEGVRVASQGESLGRNSSEALVHVGEDSGEGGRGIGFGRGAGSRDFILPIDRDFVFVTCIVVVVGVDLCNYFSG